MASTIRAAVCRSFGSPLSIETVSLAAPGPGELRVRVGAVAICHSDVSYVDGEWGGDLPAIWGHEAAGTIVEVGDGVGFEVGTPVVVTLIRSCGECPRCQNGAEVACRTSFLLDNHTPLSDADGQPIAHGMLGAGVISAAIAGTTGMYVLKKSGASIKSVSSGLLGFGLLAVAGMLVIASENNSNKRRKIN